MATVPGAPVYRPDSESRSPKQLRRDRITAVAIILGMIALMGVLTWLATLGNGTPTSDYDWWMMP